MVIVADTREPPNWQKFADKTDDILVDFVVEGKVAKFVIERKTVWDFYQSLNEDRIWHQIERLLDLKTQGYKPVVMIHGNIYAPMKKKLSAGRIADFIAFANILGVDVILLPNENAARNYLRKLDEYVEGKEANYVRPRHVIKKNRTFDDEVKDIVIGIRGIGGKMASKLLERFPSVESIVNASEEELAEVVGKSKAKHMYRILHYEVKK